MRVGIGYDVHAFADGRALVLGGVTVPSERGLTGHSDADVLSHAITDAILGGAALGDMGDHFPSSDPRWEGATSTEFMARAAAMIHTVALAVSSIDTTIILEHPPIARYRSQIRQVLSDVLSLDIEHVSVKATTTDGLGVIGRGEGAAALAVVTLGSV
jgi:2-C-methyl-D-erythritol 2,4-cyclodiphosphate synthase